VSGDLRRLEKSLRDLSERHKDSVMLGRTLLQPAPPVTFGLKVAGWLAAIRRGKQDFEGALQAAGVLQFGGASGTLASLGNRGIEVREALNRELCFESPTGASALAAPWHTQRDRMGTFICACGVLTGSLGKMARDISLLMQHEVAEVFEPGGEGRGGSSTMPNKRNPTACSLTLAAAQRVPGLVATYLSTMVQEHERGLGGWQAEWPVVAAVVQSTGVAAVSMAEVAEGLVVDKEKMRADLGNTRGVIFAERAMMILGAKVGRDEAHKILQAASQRVNQQHSLSAVLAAMPEVTAHLSAAELADLETPENYLGSAELFRKSLLAESAPEKSASHERESHEQEK
jgi:3-carboxy-cis,cis-muconate cycloisomerase